jgi:hypothetical protein
LRGRGWSLSAIDAFPQEGSLVGVSFTGFSREVDSPGAAWGFVDYLRPPP